MTLYCYTRINFAPKKIGIKLDTKWMLSLRTMWHKTPDSDNHDKVIKFCHGWHDVPTLSTEPKSNWICIFDDS